MNIPDKKYIHSITLSPCSPYKYIWDWEVQVYVPPSDATNTGCTVRDALYAIGYSGPLFNHLDLYEHCQVAAGYVVRRPKVKGSCCFMYLHILWYNVYCVCSRIIKKGCRNSMFYEVLYVTQKTLSNILFLLTNNMSLCKEDEWHPLQ